MSAKRSRRRVRRGSIVVVLLVVAILGIGATAAYFMSSGMARTDKRSELNQVSSNISQAAIEETLLKISNNAATWQPNTKLAYAPAATTAMYGGRGVEVKPVQVMARVTEKPTNPDARRKFDELMTASPGFSKDHVDKWWEKAPWTDAKWAAMITPRKGEGDSYYSSYVTPYRNRGSFQDGGKIRNAFWGLPKLTEMPAWKTDPKNTSHGTGDLDNFKERWNVAMSAVADRVDERVAGCGGNPNYGVGAELAAFALGACADADQAEEEEFRTSAQAGGVLNYTANLVTLRAETVLKTAGLTAGEPVTAERIVQTISLKESMNRLRGNLVAYLIQFYNLTPKDFELLGWGATGDDGIVAPRDPMLADLNQRYPDNPNPKVWPYQLATCRNKPQ